jgi:ubiquinol-cytochrome c reductase cytochrome c subunit
MSFVRVHLALAAFAAASLVLGHGPAAASSAENGKAAFIKNGCWQCHGFEGQGSVAASAGRIIAETQLPLDAFISFVRTTNGDMPPYSQDILSDSDLADIYAYLKSRPRPKSVTDIPLLNQIH